MNENEEMIVAVNAIYMIYFDLSKIDITMTTTNKKTLKSIKAEFCAI